MVSSSVKVFNFYHVDIFKLMNLCVSVQFCKNIVLAGVGSVTLVDDRIVTEDSLSANFLIPPEESIYKGKTLAELCCDSLKEFNPMVRVSVVKGQSVHKIF